MKSNREALDEWPIRIRRLLKKRLEDKAHAKKYRRQLRQLGFYLAKKTGMPSLQETLEDLGEDKR